jgi:hypothetical protein
MAWRVAIADWTTQIGVQEAELHVADITLRMYRVQERNRPMSGLQKRACYTALPRDACAISSRIQSAKDQAESTMG